MGRRRHPIAWWQDTSVEQSFCGTQKASKSSGPPLDHHSSFSTPRRRRSCGKPSLGSPTCSRLGMRMGGLGLRSVARMPAAYWASWADALPMVHERPPGVAQNAVTALEGDDELEGCLGELRVAAVALDRQGFVGRPQWGALQMGARPPPAHDTEPGEWAHGWQHYAASASENHFRKSVVFANRALLTRPTSALLLHGCPTRPEFKIDPVLFAVLVLERLRVPLQVTEARCECGAALDSKGRHRAACPHSGRLRTRALAPERTLARVCREAGASVRCNAKLFDMNVAVHANDERAVEVLASGLPLFHGAQLAVDITLSVPCLWHPSPRGRSCGWHCVRGSTSGQRTEVLRAPLR